MLISPYSWDLPDRGTFWSAQLFDRLIRQIDITVRSVQLAIRSVRTVVISNAIGSFLDQDCVALYSGPPFLVSAGSDGNPYVPLSYYPQGPLRGAFMVQRSGSLVHFQLAGVLRAAQQSYSGLSPSASLQSQAWYRLVIQPGSLVVPGSGAAWGCGAFNGETLGHAIVPLNPGQWVAELQVSLRPGSSNQGSYYPLFTGDTWQVIATETRS